MGIKISRKPKRFVFLFFGILSLILTIGSITMLVSVSHLFDFVFPTFLIILLVSCPASLTFLLIAYTRRKQPPDIQTKIEFMKSQYKSYILRDTSKAYVCMVCKRDIDLNQDIQICPSCNAYYHEAHLFQWLQVNTTCPVCGFDYYRNALKTRKRKK